MDNSKIVKFWIKTTMSYIYIYIDQTKLALTSSNSKERKTKKYGLRNFLLMQKLTQNKACKTC